MITPPITAPMAADSKLVNEHCQFQHNSYDGGGQWYTNLSLVVKTLASDIISKL